jgi:inner membrane protein
MPSPVGHALAGAAAAWLVCSLPPVRVSLEPQTPRQGWRQILKRLLPLTLLFGAVGTLPDIDLAFGNHSGPTHGLGAAVLAGLVAWIVLKVPGPWAGAAPRSSRLALAVAAAYASHTVLDWMGNDTTAPIGVMALWPVSREFYESNLHIFMAISRRHWLPGFWAHNLTAVAVELLMLGPIFAAVVWWRSKR